MNRLLKHWRSLKEAREELLGWQNKWYDWYYPYSKILSIGKEVVIVFVVAAGLYFITGMIKYFN